MRAIFSSVSAGVYEPNDVDAMSLAYEEICKALHINGDAGARDAIAVRVIELALRGERCPMALRDRVVAEANIAITAGCGSLESLLRAGSDLRRASWRMAAIPLGRRLQQTTAPAAASNSADPAI